MTALFSCLSIRMLPTILDLAYTTGRVTGAKISEFHDLISAKFLFISIHYLHFCRCGKEVKPTKAPILI